MARLQDNDGNLLGGLFPSFPVKDEEAEVTRLLERVHSLSHGDTHHPVDLQLAGGQLGFSTQQVMFLLSHLVRQGLLLPVEEPGRIALYLTPLTVKKMASVQTRQ